MSTELKIEFPADTIVFEINGKEHRLDVVRAMHELWDISEKVEQGDNIAYCERFQEFLKSQSIELSYARVTVLIQHVKNAYDEFKKKLADLQTSVTTTD